MKISLILSYAAFLLIGGTIGYMVGISSGKPSKPTPHDSNSVAAEPSLSAGTPTAPTEATPAPSEPVADAPAEGVPPSSTPAAATTKPAPAPAGTLPDADLCFTGDELGALLTQYAEGIEAQKLWYDPALMQDCSGIFFRLLEEFAQKRCPDYPYPSPKSARPCRLIAQWFFEHKNFSLIEDPMEKRNLIKPGAVMFYGRPGQSFKNMTIERMCGSSGAIFHVGVVTAVEKDAEGNVSKYTLFHGRTTGTFASRTYYHGVDGPSKRGQPILGVGSEQWVGISYLFTPQS
ncbi:MAG: hypothetical protein ACKVUS_08800 [Saprospiraceae bacterium]